MFFLLVSEEYLRQASHYLRTSKIYGEILKIFGIDIYEKHLTSPSSLDVAKYSWNLRHPATAFELHLLSLIFRGHQKYLEIFQGHRKYSEQYWFRFPSQNGAKYCAVLATFAPFCDETVTSLTGVKSFMFEDVILS